MDDNGCFAGTLEGAAVVFEHKTRKPLVPFPHCVRFVLLHPAFHADWASRATVKTFHEARWNRVCFIVPG